MVLGLLPLRAEEENVFGNEKQAAGEAALMGVFYDLKQTQDRKPTNMTLKEFEKNLEEFISKGWDESVLSRFYRATRPLYVTQIFVPMISASEGPKAFNVEKWVEPNFFVIYYRGQIAAPKSGTFRFWAYGDNICTVAINGKLRVVGNRKSLPFTRLWKATDPKTFPAGNGEMIAGDWMDIKANDPMDIDVLVGEHVGGVSGFFLMIEEKGVTYATEQGRLILPILQLAPFDTPVRPLGVQPKFAKESVIWRGIQ